MNNEQRLFFGNPLNQFENGIQLDLRVKLAADFIKAGSFGTGSAFTIVKQSLDAADELVKQAIERGWTRDLPDTDDLSAPMRRFIRQNTRAQVYQQIVGQQIAEEEQPTVKRANGPIPIRQ